MGFLDRLFGTPEPERRPAPAAARPQRSEDELAVERYRYLLRTAPPESIEAVHTEAFAKLTPEQRRLVYANLADQLPAGERLVSDEPSALARAATRAELRQPGTIERTISAIPVPGAPGSGTAGFDGGQGYAQQGARYAQAGAQPGLQGGPSFGSMFASSLLGSIAGYVIGSAIMSAFLPDPGYFDAADGGGADEAAADDASIEAAGADAGAGDGGWGDFGGGDFGGGDFGDFGF